jgi:hypothetical protein
MCAKDLGITTNYCYIIIIEVFHKKYKRNNLIEVVKKYNEKSKNL